MPSDPIRRIAVLSSAGQGGAGLAARRMAGALAGQPELTVDFLDGPRLGGLLPPQVAPTANMSNNRLTNTLFTIEYPGFRRDAVIEQLVGYDLLNIHWTAYLLSLAELDALAARGQRMLFMLHDFNHLTGGCHYPATCQQLSSGCKTCPQVDEARADRAVVPVVRRIRRAIFKHPNVHIAVPSAFLAGQAVASGMVPAQRVHLLRNPYDPPPSPDGPDRPTTDTRVPGTIRIALIADTLFERRKGMALALDSLNVLADDLAETRPGQRVLLDVVGHTDDVLRAHLARCRVPSQLHGHVTDHSALVALMAAADIVLICSFEDNWPNILVEAGAQGCIPVVGPGHGCAEFVHSFDAGRVAQDYSAPAFASALRDLIGSAPSAAARQDLAQRVRRAHRGSTIARRFQTIAAAIPAGISG